MTRAEEIRTLVAAYTRQLDYLATMAETNELPNLPLQLAEDEVSRFLNGGNCTTTAHVSAGRLVKLVMLKMLRLDMPHVSMQLQSLEHEIREEAKRPQ